MANEKPEPDAYQNQTNAHTAFERISEAAGRSLPPRTKATVEVRLLFEDGSEFRHSFEIRKRRSSLLELLDEWFGPQLLYGDGTEAALVAVEWRVDYARAGMEAFQVDR